MLAFTEDRADIHLLEAEPNHRLHGFARIAAPPVLPADGIAELDVRGAKGPLPGQNRASRAICVSFFGAKPGDSPYGGASRFTADAFSSQSRASVLLSFRI